MQTHEELLEDIRDDTGVNTIPDKGKDTHIFFFFQFFPFFVCFYIILVQHKTYVCVNTYVCVEEENFNNKI